MKKTIEKRVGSKVIVTIFALWMSCLCSLSANAKTVSMNVGDAHARSLHVQIGDSIMLQGTTPSQVYRVTKELYESCPNEELRSYQGSGGEWKHQILPGIVNPILNFVSSSASLGSFFNYQEGESYYFVAVPDRERGSRDIAFNQYCLDGQKFSVDVLAMNELVMGNIAVARSNSGGGALDGTVLSNARNKIESNTFGNFKLHVHDYGQSDTLNKDLLKELDILFVGDMFSSFHRLSVAEVAAVKSWIAKGGRLLLSCQVESNRPNDLCNSFNVSGERVGYNSLEPHSGYALHPLFEGISSLQAYPANSLFSAADIAAEQAKSLAIDPATGGAGIVEINHGNGVVVMLGDLDLITNDTVTAGSNFDTSNPNDLFLRNLINHLINPQSADVQLTTNLLNYYARQKQLDDSLTKLTGFEDDNIELFAINHIDEFGRLYLRSLNGKPFNMRSKFQPYQVRVRWAIINDDGSADIHYGKVGWISPMGNYGFLLRDEGSSPLPLPGTGIVIEG